MSKFQRNGHLVRSRVQRAVLLRFVCQWVSLGAVYFIVAFWLHFLLDGPAEPASTTLRLMWQRYALLVVISFALLPYFLYDLIKLTHRFAGPMVRFGDTLHRAALGEKVEPIKFRDGDYWQELAIDLNLLLARIPHDEPAAASSFSTAKSEASVEEAAELVTA